MATITPTTLQGGHDVVDDGPPVVYTRIPVGVIRSTWSSFTEADTGAGVDVSKYADKVVQLFGTWGAGTVLIEGSNDGGTTWDTLNDPQGNALSFTADKTEQVLEFVGMIRPRATAGSSMSITVVLSGKQTT